MGLIQYFKQKITLYKAFKKYKNIQTAPNRSEESYIIEEEDRKAGLDIRRLNAERKRLERRRDFLERQTQILELAEEVDALEKEVYGEDEEEQPQNHKQSLEEMFLSNIFTAMNKNKNQEQTKQKTLNSFYPTGNEETISFNTGVQEESNTIPDEDIKNFLQYLNPQQKEFIGKLPKNTLLRAHDLINDK